MVAEKIKYFVAEYWLGVLFVVLLLISQLRLLKRGRELDRVAGARRPAQSVLKPKRARPFRTGRNRFRFSV